MTEQIKRDFKRRAAIDRMGRNYLAHATGDAINSVLAAAATTSAA